MKLPLWLCAWLLEAECGMILIFIPGRWTDRAIQQESTSIKQHFGTQGYLWLETQASSRRYDGSVYVARMDRQ